jgi:integrase
MSVRKRTWTTAKDVEKEAWVVDYFDADGNRRLETYKTKAAARAAETQIRGEVVQGVHTPTSTSLTVGQAGERWIENGEAAGLQRTTLNGYRAHLEQHIKPFLGSLKLAKLTPATIREFANAMRLGKRGKPRTPDMVRRVLVSLGSLLAFAHEHGLVAQNVSRGLRKGGRRPRQKLQVGVDIPSTHEIRALIGALKGRYRPLLLTAIFTGLRASELRGLRWKDVDLKKAELHVRQRADAFNAIDKPKSHAGERRVPLTPLVVNTLRTWQKDCPESRLDLTFPTRSGEPDHHANIITRGLIPAMIAANLTVPVLDDAGKPVRDAKGKPKMTAKYTGLHCLRHFYASWCLNRKDDGGLELPMKLVQERLGHATLAMTSDTYGHVFRPVDDRTELAEGERRLLA